MSRVAFFELKKCYICIKKDVITIFRNFTVILKIRNSNTKKENKNKNVLAVIKKFFF